MEGSRQQRNGKVTVGVNEEPKLRALVRKSKTSAYQM